jgi:hypothetical protein
MLEEDVKEDVHGNRSRGRRREGRRGRRRDQGGTKRCGD